MGKEGDAGSRKNAMWGFYKSYGHSSAGRTGPEVVGMDVCEGKSVYRKGFRAGWAVGSSKV